MKTIRYLIQQRLIVVILSLVSSSSLISQSFNDISKNYKWDHVKIGAGGWMVGIDMQKEGNVIYSRADVGGAYRLEAGSDTWVQLVDTSSVPDLLSFDSYHYGVMSIVSAPSDENVVYMVFANGNFYRSDNQGDNWVKKTLHVYVEENGTARCQGERIAVDPVNDSIVYYASHREGLKRTDDAGATWETIAQVPIGTDESYGIGTVVFDPNGGSENGKSLTIYATVHETGVYRSTDGGVTWSNISEGIISNGQFEDAEIGPDGSYYTILANLRETWRYKNEEWKLIQSGSPDPLRDIVVDPFNADRIFVTNYSGKSYRSLDGGESWEFLSIKRESNTDIPWLAFTEVGWFSNGEIIFDTKVPGKLWICEGIGIWTTTDIEDSEITWSSVSKGIEELVSNDIISPPGGRPLASFWDRAIFRIESLDVYPSEHYPSYEFDSGWDLSYCPTATSFIVATVADHRGCCLNNVTCYSEDRGKTWTIFDNLPEDGKHGNIAVAAQNPHNIVLLPGSEVNPYYSTDKGNTWKQSSFEGTTNGAYNWYSSGQDILTSDAVDSSTFYIYHRDKGIYRSVDGGESWNLINTEVPLGAIKKVKLRSVPGKAKHLILSLGIDVEKPLYRSTDGGETWNAFPGTQAMMVTLGKAFEGASYPCIYYYGFKDGKRGIWRSINEGNIWEKIGDYPLGITARLNAFEADNNHFGLVYVGFPGNGIAYAYDLAYPPDFNIDELPPVEIVEIADFVQWPSSNKYTLSQNYPNPFNNNTSIEYELPREENVLIKVLDLSCKEVLVLDYGRQNAGKHTVEFNMQGKEKGLYLCKLLAGPFSKTTKILFQ